LSRQVTLPAALQTPESPALGPWIRFLRAHASLTRELSARLVAEHGLTLNDYDALMQLARAEGRQLRRVDLAARVLLTASGITRLLDGLERAGWVERGVCESDARVSYAVLTDAGLEKLREASASHVRDVEVVFGGRFTGDELVALSALLDRLPDASPNGETCSVE
jgi:DNA-binding MarR family transcriptional regulator